MPAVSVVFGLLLMALGIWSYWGGVLGLWEPLGLTPPTTLSGTALIPAYVGMLLVVCGLTAFKPSLFKHAMHGAAAIGVLGLLASTVRLLMVATVNGVGGVSLISMMVLCLIFVALCVNSFVQVRRRRRAASPSPSP